MVCQNCNSSDLKRVSLIYAQGLFKSRGRLHGLFLGNRDGLHFGRYRGTSHNHLSMMLRPPTKGRYVTPTILWLLRFFLVIAFASRGTLTTPMAIASVTYLFLLPAGLVGIFVHNLYVYPRKFTNWERTFMCQRCGALAEVQAETKVAAQTRVW
jgi:hypothetical protein